MSKHYGSIAFTDDVRAVQCDHGSRAFYDRKRNVGQASSGPDPLTADEKDYLGQRDSFYLATVGEAGWPYVQFREVQRVSSGAWTTTPSGGPTSAATCNTSPPVTSQATTGSRSSPSTTRTAADLKVFGHARIVTADEDPDLVGSLVDPEYRAVVERAVIVAVEAYDWNCPQHITPRLTAAELETELKPVRDQLAVLQAENARLREQLHDRH